MHLLWSLPRPCPCTRVGGVDSIFSTLHGVCVLASYVIAMDIMGLDLLRNVVQYEVGIAAILGRSLSKFGHFADMGDLAPLGARGRSRRRYAKPL